MSWKNENYKSPNYNALRKSTLDSLRTITFSNGVSIDAKPTIVMGPRFAVRVMKKIEIEYL